ncbi:PAS domain-containing sensor histidine kinase [Raineya orbicola]|uniref:histidine kinase n=1 Tax=Raineya orbicola TaxID=2016530 RepID=A0A2N3I8C6_9BACT|nr:PAS domain-containing sensor histidine kinase [Raineya orbicola]PKQ66567.1 PAS domain S-box protein [Raineya orbicola]
MGKYINKASFASEKDIFASVFKHASIGIILTDHTGVILLANPFAEQLFGYNEKELNGKTIEDLIPENLRDLHRNHRENYNIAPRVRTMGENMNLLGLRKNGTTFNIEASLGYFKTDTQIFIMAFIYDVTKQRENEKAIIEQKNAIEQYSAEIRALNESLEEQIKIRTKALLETLQHLENSKKELEKALSKERELGELKSRFVSMASHEFRTPLSTILSSVQLIAKYEKTDEQDKRLKHIQRITNSVNHLNDILEEFLSMGKIEEGKIQPTFQEVHLPKCFQEVISEMQAIAKEGQKLSFSHIGEENIVTDCSILKKILINLLSNAIKFSAEHKLIRLQSQKNTDGLTIQVIDEGIGISEKDQKHLFERFFRAENALNIKGTGLGLYIVAKFTEMLGGTILVDSELGKGTTITLFFTNQI